MAANLKQKITLIDINAGSQTAVEAKLLEGYVITHIVNLQPAQNKLLIIYALPPEP